MWRRSQARPLLEEALTARRETLGNRHPNTLTSIGNLSTLLQAQGKLDQVRSCMRPTARARLVRRLHAVWWTACLVAHRVWRPRRACHVRASRCMRVAAWACGLARAT